MRKRGVATLQGERDIRIVLPAIGVEFRGSIIMTGIFEGRMVLSQFGGAGNGRTYELGYDDGPG
jgi:hypothetical protein